MALYLVKAYYLTPSTQKLSLDKAFNELPEAYLIIFIPTRI